MKEGVGSRPVIGGGRTEAGLRTLSRVDSKQQPLLWGADLDSAPGMWRSCVPSPSGKLVFVPRGIVIPCNGTALLRSSPGQVLTCRCLIPSAIRDVRFPQRCTRFSSQLQS